MAQQQYSGEISSAFSGIAFTMAFRRAAMKGHLVYGNLDESLYEVYG